MSNFAFLGADKRFAAFADAADAAEKTYAIDQAACALNCRRALESAIRWMYSVDDDLEMPYNDSLKHMMDGKAFRDIVGNELLSRIDYIRRAGNDASHTDTVFSDEEAMLCLENLHAFMDFVAFCYCDPGKYQKTDFDPAKVVQSNKVDVGALPVEEQDMHELLEENQALRALLTARRAEQKAVYVPKPLNLSEYRTRKMYIDSMLRDAAWQEGVNWKSEVEVRGMPNETGVGYVDYVLFGQDQKPLALIEAKKTDTDATLGRQQARLYADLLEKQYGQRPAIYLSNGFETRFCLAENEPERSVAAIHSCRDLTRLFKIRQVRRSLHRVSVRRQIADRPYQREAVHAVCNAFDRTKRRRALVSMAAGTGKTRVMIALVEVLRYHKWLGNVLLLAENESLVRQIKQAFDTLLPDAHAVNLCEEMFNTDGRCMIATYDHMTDCIDDVQDKQGRVFTCGRFDLIILDEAHEAVLEKYQSLLSYFDAHLLGMTATPVDEIPPSAWTMFQLPRGEATYCYDQEQAVQEGYLVPCQQVDCNLKFLSRGIVYADLSPDDKAAFERTFAGNSAPPAAIPPALLADRVLNKDTIREALRLLMEKGIRTGSQGEIGKTIVFAQGLEQAEMIRQLFNEMYPQHASWAAVIGRQVSYVQSLIDAFAVPDKPPYIAISVDALDAGVDVPQVVNLMFFKRVWSRSRFWQMLGRGMRPCPGLVQGRDKERCLVFDLMGNFAFFQGNGERARHTLPLEGQIFSLQAQLALALQDMNWQQEGLQHFRRELVQTMLKAVRELDRDSWQVKMHLKCAELYALEESYHLLTGERVRDMTGQLAPLMGGSTQNEATLKIDVLLYTLILDVLRGETKNQSRQQFLALLRGLKQMAHIPQIAAQAGVILPLLTEGALEKADVLQLENARRELRDLGTYLPAEQRIQVIDLDDTRV